MSYWIKISSLNDMSGHGLHVVSHNCLIFWLIELIFWDIRGTIYLLRRNKWRNRIDPISAFFRNLEKNAGIKVRKWKKMTKEEKNADVLMQCIWTFKEQQVRKGYVHSWAITIIPSIKGYKLPTVYPSMLGIIVIAHECTYPLRTCRSLSSFLDLIRGYSGWIRHFKKSALHTP